MSIFFVLFDKMLPLYVLIGLGYIARRYLKVQKESIASLLVYIVVPIVVFSSVATTNLNATVITLPVLFFCICCAISLATYYVAGLYWKNATRNMVGFIAGSGNTGYFGLPVAVALFGSRSIPIVALALIGTSLYNNTFGFFLAAKGRHTTQEALMKVLQLPVLYAFVAALIVNWLGLRMGSIYTNTAADFNGAYIVLGMMLVGIGLADIKKFEFDAKFLGLSLVSKFIVWPLLMLTILVLDSHTVQLFSPSIHHVLLLLAIVPVAANTVSYATILNTEPEKASLAVFISTLFALFYVPAVAAVFF